ncbi:MAG: isopentenyl-diphosphate delta-isomerase [Crocinitomicaceae bacterium]|nr:isopentenyl-diphosphate delta-isomerase [Crocinitomicaceae bacterium]|tara:strand:- start:10131 stop:10664 length:534 start_codon:yes stop_codon:yes gene_type:complete
MNGSEYVILVDDKDNAIGRMEKYEAHSKGVLHRAFSIFLFNKNGELLLQQRAECKYHSANLWSNTCCGHPRPDEPTTIAANRRLMEELGIECKLSETFNFTYEAKMENGLIEHELDHVFIGDFSENCHPNPREVKAWVYVPLDVIEHDINHFPNKYSEWFKLVFPKLRAYWYKQKAA